jgi:hypothetical protein
MLVEILGGNSIAARCRFACQGEVALEYLVGAAADLGVGPVAVECLIVLRDFELGLADAVGPCSEPAGFVRATGQDALAI